MISIPLSLCESYVSDWTIADAIREIIQNALDAGGEQITINGNSITISNDGEIGKDELLLGAGSKSIGDSQRGQYGEGFKLALLILARNGCDVEVYTGSEKWEPVMKRSEYFNEPHLHIEVEDLGDYCGEVSFEISGIPSSDMQQIKNNTLYLQELDDVRETEYGRILLDTNQSGKIYCGGLFVSSFGDLDYGYDFNPDVLSLDRDRKTVNGWDAQWYTAKMWAEITEEDDSDEISEAFVNCLYTKSKESQHYSYHKSNVPDKVAEKAFEVYQEKYDGQILAENYEEAEALKNAGHTNVIDINKPEFVKVLKQSNGYREISMELETKSTIDLLEDWKDKWSDNFNSEMLEELEEIIDKL